MRTPAQALEALRALACGRDVLVTFGPQDGVLPVGGAVRDALLGREPRELDLVVQPHARAHDHVRPDLHVPELSARIHHRRPMDHGRSPTVARKLPSAARSPPTLARPSNIQIPRL